MGKARTIGLLGGSFNPAHEGHRFISLFAIESLGLDEVWWLVTPGNPLKQGASDMAPLVVRYRCAQAMARRSRIRATAIEQSLGTRFTVDTVEALARRYPNFRFIWLMGGDNLAQFHRWKSWRTLAATMPIAVFARPGYERAARASRAMGALRNFVHSAKHKSTWTNWRPPALVLLRFRPDKHSATAIRRAHPDWSQSFSQQPLFDPLSRRRVV